MVDVNQEKFQGPLGLLLELIEGEKLDITQISLAKIADQYVGHIKAITAIHSDELADFLVVAARLLLIKSRALLPYLYPEEEEEMKELENQLRMYKEFVEASKKIEVMIGDKKFMYGREFNRQTILASAQLFSPPKNLTREELLMVFSDLLIRLKPVEKLEEERLERKIHIEEKIAHIRQLLLEGMNINFSKIMAEAESKTEIVVTFLAMLELIKHSHISAAQSDIFGEIEISRTLLTHSHNDNFKSL